MSILSGFLKTKKYRKKDEGNYQLQSEWTSSETVEMGDGNTLETNLGSIKGITDSLVSTSSNIALSAKVGKDLNESLTAETAKVGVLSALTTSVKTSIVNAINSLVTAVNGKAPTRHSSSGTEYGAGTTSNYGHVKISNSISSSSSNGVALSPYGGYVIQRNLDNHAFHSLHLVGNTENVIYGMYLTGYYPIFGSEAGLPLTGYRGFGIAINDGDIITKMLILVNAYVYTMSQSAKDPSVIYTPWKLISPN